MEKDWVEIVALTLLAGIAMPVGAAIAGIERVHPRWLEADLRHGVIAFGGGALLAAVALILVPQGMTNLTPLMILLCFSSGGIAFMVIDMKLATRVNPSSQLIAMLADFLPEALALGAAFAASKSSGLLLAGIIALQNLPEGFNACREIVQSAHYRVSHVVGAFSLLALLGPASGLVGHFYLSSSPKLISAIMLFSAGGILYLVFQDIAPQSKMKKHWAPPLGAVAGFLIGMLGKLATGG